MNPKLRDCRAGRDPRVVEQRGGAIGVRLAVLDRHRDDRRRRIGRRSDLNRRDYIARHGPYVAIIGCR